MADEAVAHQPNLTTRNGTFYLRMRVPLDVVASLRQTHIVVSLKTKERRIALTRFRLEQARAERQFEAARREAVEGAALRRVLASGRLEKATTQDIEGLAHRWYEHAVQQVSLAARDASSAEFIDWDVVLDDAKADAALLTSPYPERYMPIVDPVVDRVLLAAGMPPEPYGNARIRRQVRRAKVDRDSPQYGYLTALIRRGLIELSRRNLSHLTGETSAHSLMPNPILMAAPARSLDALLQAFASDPGRGSRTSKTDADYGMVVAALREVIGGDTDVQRITREQARRVRALFSSLPPNATKRFRGKSLMQAAEIAARDKLPTLNSQTINSHVTKMSTLFNWALREEWINKNPASGLTIEEDRKKRREPFSIDQLMAIFSAPIFTGCEDDANGYARPGLNHPRRARFWVPLLSLFHGLRLNEACQLRPSDIAERDGIPVILVRAAEADQRVKSRAGTRIVPLHPEIISIGFVEFVREARQRGSERLFSELSRDTRGYFSDAFQKWFSRFLQSCGVARSGTTFHSFRHGWADRLREANVPEDRRRALGGWANTGVDAGYGRGFPTKMLAADIASVTYPGLILDFEPRRSHKASAEVTVDT